MIGYYSRYIEIAKLSTTTSSNVISHMKSIFARHGIPDILISNNGSQYAAQEFAENIKEENQRINMKVNFDRYRTVKPLVSLNKGEEVFIKDRKEN